MSDHEGVTGGGKDDPDGSDREDSLNWIRRRDEILEVLFWLEGEGFAGEMTASTVARFLTWPEAETQDALDRLVREGYAERSETADEGAADRAGEPRYTLSHDGRQEGGRRFVEEFATMLSRDTHGEACDDPDCACHYEGAAACENRTSEEMR